MTQKPTVLFLASSKFKSMLVCSDCIRYMLPNFYTHMYLYIYISIHIYIYIYIYVFIFFSVCENPAAPAAPADPETLRLEAAEVVRFRLMATHLEFHGSVCKKSNSQIVIALIFFLTIDSVTVFFCRLAACSNPTDGLQRFSHKQLQPL